MGDVYWLAMRTSQIVLGLLVLIATQAAMVQAGNRCRECDKQKQLNEEKRREYEKQESQARQAHAFTAQASASLDSIGLPRGVRVNFTCRGIPAGNESLISE